MSLNLKEIWKLQGELNTIISRDTINAPNKQEWAFDYTIALHDEATELFNCTNYKWWSSEGKDQQYFKIIDLPNAKIEAVDCLHFLISLMQVCDTKLDIDFCENTWDDAEFYVYGKEHLLSKFSLDLISDSVKILNFIQDCSDNYVEEVLKKNHSDNFKEKFKESLEVINFMISNCLRLLISVFNILEFEKSDLLRIYKMKHEKNLLRQKNGYSVVNKTEDDNNEIKKNI